MKRRVCSFDMIAVPVNSYTVTDDEGDVYLCNARCLCLWSMTHATKPGLAEELKTQTLRLETPTSEQLSFASLIELAGWVATNASHMSLVKTER